MRPVSDDFLLSIAEVSATLIGLFLIGVFFYIEGGLGKWGSARQHFASYLRAGTRITLIVLAIPTFLSFALVAMEIAWARAIFVLLSIMLLMANIESVARVFSATKTTRSSVLLINELVTTALALTLIALPWILGGSSPSREDLTWAILLAFAAGFLSIGSTVLSAFDAEESKPKT